MELVITNSPISEPDKRILERAQVKYERLGRWYSFALTGDEPEHQFRVRSRHTGWFTETRLEIRLHGDVHRSSLMRMRSDLKVKRLWISRGYVYGDLGRACARIVTRHATPGPWAGNLRFATLKDEAGEVIDGESQVSYEYGSTARGAVRLDLHGGHAYALEWRAHPDGLGRDYRTTWFRNDEVIEETIESVFETEEWARTGCLALKGGSYCDTDQI